MTSFPAISADAVLAGMQECGLDAAKIRALSGLATRYQDPMALLPNSVWESIWQHAATLDTRPELPSLVATQIPFGLFGSLDYLAGSAQTVRGGIQSLCDHFSAATSGIELEFNTNTDINTDTDAANVATLRIIHVVTQSSQHITDEFTTAVILGRFSKVSHGQFCPQRVYLTRPQLPHAPHTQIFGAPVVYGAARSGFDIPLDILDATQTMADARLHDTLLGIAKKLGFGSNENSNFETAVRARLRSLMPRGQAVAQRVADSLGVSERTLHRLLSKEGSSFRRLLDQFRIEESERLLLQGQVKLVDIAIQLGFSDQATWTRAFRRLRGVSPLAWQSANSRVR